MRPLNIALLVAIFVAIVTFAVVLLQPAGPVKQVANKIASEPREIAFRDAVLDSKSLGSQRAFVRIRGLYSNTGNLFYGPDHRSGGGGSINLLSDDAPREVRAYLLDCGKRPGSSSPFSDYCPVSITGHFTTCFYKINKEATFPCLSVERVDPDR